MESLSRCPLQVSLSRSANLNAFHAIDSRVLEVV